MNSHMPSINFHLLKAKERFFIPNDVHQHVEVVDFMTLVTLFCFKKLKVKHIKLIFHLFFIQKTVQRKEKEGQEEDMENVEEIKTLKTS